MGPRRHRAFGRDQSGVSAVEFALIAPVILLLLIGLVETNEALTIHRKLRHVSSTVTDLIAQQSLLSSSQASLTLSGAASMMAPYDTSELDIVLTVIDVATNKQTVAWSRGYQVAPEQAGDAAGFPVPAALVTVGTQMVAVRVNYNFSTVFTNLFASVLGRDRYFMEDRMYARPRRGEKVELAS